jgi:hypothetical protein
LCFREIGRLAISDEKECLKHIIIHRDGAGIAQPQRGPTKHDLKIRSREICDPVGGVL